MKKVIITNLVTNEIWRNLEIEDPTEWIASCIANDSWGLPARECKKTAPHAELLVIEEYEKEIEAQREEPIYEVDSNGDLVMEDYWYYDPIAGKDILGQRPIPTGETTTIPAKFETWVKLNKEYDIEITDITDIYNARERVNRKKANGNNLRSLQEGLIDLVTGDNLENRTAEQITQMEIDFSTIFTMINGGRLISVKPLIEAIDIVANPQYEELKTDILNEYTFNGF